MYKIYIFITLFVTSNCYININDYGAIPNVTTDAQAIQNSIAIMNALYAANMEGQSDRTVLVPAGGTYQIVSVNVYGLFHVTLQIDGSLKASSNRDLWPGTSNQYAILYFEQCSYLNIYGSQDSVIDGQGWIWWMTTFLFPHRPDNRPFLMKIYQSDNININNLHLLNSPFWNLYLDDVMNVVVRNSTIIADVLSQKELFKTFGYWEENFPIYGIPTFPLNTDGIDVRGQNVLIENVFVQTYDDAFVPKPSTTASKYGPCTSNIVVRNCQVNFGVGASVGSVPPNVNHNCVDGVLFENITFQYALKVIYIKSNPGTEGDGLIRNITYRNIYSASTLWMPLWIGPQQQRQPGTVGTGCTFLYPLIPTCPTQPRVTIKDITIENVAMENSLLLPGVVLGDPTNPIQNLMLRNITNYGLRLVNHGYWCQNAYNITQSLMDPPLECVST